MIWRAVRVRAWRGGPKVPTAERAPISLCKSCVRIKNAAYREANREKIRAQQRHAREMNPDLARAKVKRWVEENRDHWVRQQAEYHAANREQRNAKSRAYNRANPERRRARNAKAKLLRRVDFDLDAAEYAIALRGDPCSYCGGPMSDIDHIDAVACGGTSHWSNLTAACRRCNGRKRTRSLLEFMRVAA